MKSFEPLIESIFVGKSPREPSKIMEFNINTTEHSGQEYLEEIIAFRLEFKHRTIVKDGQSEFEMNRARVRFIKHLRYELYKDLYEELMILEEAMEEDRKGAIVDSISRIKKEIRGDDCKRYGQY